MNSIDRHYRWLNLQVIVAKPKVGQSSEPTSGVTYIRERGLKCEPYRESVFIFLTISLLVSQLIPTGLLDSPAVNSFTLALICSSFRMQVTYRMATGLY